MATDTTVDVSLWEKLGDGFSAFGEATGRFLTRLFGSSNERYIRKLGYIRSYDPQVPHKVVPASHLEQVNRLEEGMRALSDDELKSLTPNESAPNASATLATNPPAPTTLPPIPAGYRIQIPRLGIDLPILEGDVERDAVLQQTPENFSNYPWLAQPRKQAAKQMS